MKWIGQHIWDFISRFRNKVILEDLTESTEEYTIMVKADGELVKSVHPMERSRLQVRNDEGSTIPAGAPLYSKGEIGGSERILVGVCDADDAAKMPCIGVAEVEMNTTSTKDNFAITQGVYNTNISGFSSLSDGDIVYVSSSGSAPHLTQVKPTGEASKIQNVGIVLKTNGTICQGLLVSAVGRTNDTPNLDNNKIFVGNGSNQVTTQALNTITVNEASIAKSIVGPGDSDVTITSNGEVIVKLDSDNDENFQKFKITDNSDAVVFSVEENGVVTTSGNTITNTGSGSDLSIESDGSLSFVLDRDNDETSQAFSFRNFTTEIANLNESGNLQIDGDLTVSGNDIKDSGGNSIISSDGSGVVTMASGNIAVGGSNANINMNAGSDIVLDADQNGGGGDSTIQYPDSGGTNRIMLAADSDVVILSNRAANGTVQIRANNATAGGTGEVTVVTVEDDSVTTSAPLFINAGGPNVAITCTSSDADCMVRVSDDSTAGTNAMGMVGTGDNLVMRNDEGNFKVKMANNATDTLDLDQSGNLTVTGIITGRQREIYSQSFLDDLGTTKHYLPWKDINEQTTVYQEEAAMIMPCDGRIVSVTVRTASVTGSGNMTIGIQTIGPNVNQFGSANWTEEETETLAVASTDDYHVFHFAFDNAKHFDSGDLVSISIQNSADLSGTTYWYVSTVVEYDWSTFLGTTSGEHDSNP